MLCISKNKCCICLENSKVGLRCNYCNEGIVCNNCVTQVIESCPKCPICRQTSWHSKSKTKVIPVNKLLHVDHSGEVYTRKCERKTMFYWFMLIHILSSILCTCAIGYLTILLICSTDTVIKLGAWLLLISPIIGLLEISIFLIICCKGCGYHTVFFPEDY